MPDERAVTSMSATPMQKLRTKAEVLAGRAATGRLRPLVTKASVLLSKDSDLPRDFSDEARTIFRTVSRYTMTSAERIGAVIDAVHHIERWGIAGDVVECGVWRGGSTMAAALTLKNAGSTNRELHLFDTYEGMPEPSADDVAIDGRSARDHMDADPSRSSLVWAVASEEDVRANLMSTGYPADKMHFVKGLVEETLVANAPQTVALLRLDTDWYASTIHELEVLWPRLSSGGIMIIDDYGHWGGARKAVDEFFADVPVFLSRIDYTGRLVVKP